MQRVLKEAKEHTMSKHAEWRRRPAVMPSASSVASERALLDAAEEVVTRWAVYRVSEGELGSCGLPEALQALSRAWEAYEPEELATLRRRPPSQPAPTPRLRPRL